MTTPAPEVPGDPQDARVDAALERLDDLDGLPTSDQVPVFEDIHRRLQDALADLDPDT